MTPDDRLTAFLGEIPAPAPADVFVAEVMEAVERRAFLDRLLAGAAGALALAVVLWACSPVLNLAVNALAPTLLPVAGILALTLAVLVMGGRLLPRN
jgi:hypothetical protein